MLFDEELLTLAEAAAKLPRLNGTKPHTSTLWRWSTRGVRGVRLETRQIGRQIVTSPEALERFTRALAEAGHRESSVERHDSVRRAEKRLEDAGA